MKFTTSLKKKKEFEDVYNKGKSFANRQLVLYLLNNNTSNNKIGIVVSKKVGNSVVRSRIKRLIKESYRLNEDSFNKGFDLVLIARKGAIGTNYFQIEKSLLHLKNKFEEL